MIPSPDRSSYRYLTSAIWKSDLILGVAWSWLEPGGDESASFMLVEHVDGVVLVVGACDSECRSENLQLRHLDFWNQVSWKDECSSLEPVVAWVFLQDAADVDVEVACRVSREINEGLDRR